MKQSGCEFFFLLLECDQWLNTTFCRTKIDDEGNAKD